MKPMLFLIGGYGNAVYQIAHLKESCSKFWVSKIFYSKLIMRLLNHVHFDGLTGKYDNPNIFLTLVHLLVLLLDLLIIRIFRVSLFSEVDTYNYSAQPKIFALNYLGYFQHESFGSLRNDAFEEEGYGFSGKAVSEICIHFRYGDYMKAHVNNLPTRMPVPPKKWYETVLSRVQVNSEITVVTDNIEGAKKFFEDFEYDFKFYSSTIADDFSRIMSSRVIITFNSTFSLVAANLSRCVEEVYIGSSLSNKRLKEELVGKINIVDGA